MSVRTAPSTDSLSIPSDPRGRRHWRRPLDPVLARDAEGDVQLNLTLFRGLEPSQSGGSLLICIDLSVQRSEIAQANGTISSTVAMPLTYLHGVVRLFAPGLQTMTAPVVADQSYVAFAHHLQPEMASSLRSIILENPAQCGVVFDLVYFDARPEPAWTLQANWTDVDRRLLEQFANKAVTSEEIRGLVDELVEGGDARLEFDPAWGEAGAVTSEAARAWLTEVITGHFLEPTFIPGVGSAAAFLRRGDGMQPKESEVNARVVERHVYGQASLEEMLAATGRSGDAFVHLLDLNDLSPFPLSIEIVCPALGANLETLQVDLEYGVAGHRSVKLHSPSQRARVVWPFDEHSGRVYRYSYQGTFSGSGTPFNQPATVGDTTILIIAPPAE
jgi:hypothetical protein